MLPKVLLCVLCQSEREGWVCPPLAENLIAAVKDKRYETSVEVVTRRPVAYARNYAVAMAREAKADYLFMIDNDQHFSPHQSPLALLVPGHDVIAIPSAFHKDGTGLLGANVVPLAGPPQWNAAHTLFEVEKAGTGAMIISRHVWEKIPGPWFKWTDDELGTPSLSEDFYFCQRVREHGLKVWACPVMIPHLKTTDIAAMYAKQQPH